MKTNNELRKDLKNKLSDCCYVNDNSLASQVNECIQWAWDDWDDDLTAPYYEGTIKPDCYTKSFMEFWIDNENFEEDLKN